MGMACVTLRRNQLYQLKLPRDVFTTVVFIASFFKTNDLAI